MPYSGDPAPSYQQYEVDVAGTGKTFTYDANGNLTTDGTRTFEWDINDRLQLAKAGTTTGSFSNEIRSIDRAAVPLGARCVASGLSTDSVAAEYEVLGKVKVGMSEDEVRSLLGEPLHSYDRTTAPTDYYVEGWAFKKRPISNRVLIYVRSEPIAYVWIDQHGRVEDVFVGGS